MNTGYGCQNMNYGYYPYQTNNTGSNYAIILVLFILLVIIIGTRFTR